MSWRVLINHDFPRHGLAVMAANRIDDDRYQVIQWPEPTHGFVMVDAPVGTSIEHDPRHVLHLPEELGRPLLDALSLHYGGTSDARMLRRDYDHERERVDKMIRFLTNYPLGGVQRI